jgi:hypothetical protein
MLLRAVACHPWARAAFLQSVSGLRADEFSATAQQALAAGFIERGDIAATARAPRRFGLTPTGAAQTGEAFSLAWQRRVYLQAMKLDAARSLLHHWLNHYGIVWAVSPYCLPASAVRSPVPLSPSASLKSGDWAYRSLHLDALACLKLGERRYLHVAVMMDVDGLKLDWLFHQFRAVHAWARRPEFGRREHIFPLFVVITSEHRWSQVAQVWQASARRSEMPRALRLTIGLAALDEPVWNERGQRFALWSGLTPFERPGRRPEHPQADWYGELAENEMEAIRAQRTISAKPGRSRLLKWAARAGADSARLVRDHQATSVRSRRLLDRVGQYPLIAAGELAVVMGCTGRNVTAGLRELRARGLIEHPAEGEHGYVLTWAGLELLAAQAGFGPQEYATLRRWAMRPSQDGPLYSTTAWLATREHTRLILDFLVGLRRHGASAGLHLARWDHVQCLYEFHADDESPAAARLRPTYVRVIPDASGVMMVSGRALEFWLEVDRHTVRGQALTDKLKRYFEAHRAWWSRRPRLLVLVKPDDEARLQALRRRFQELNDAYHTRLDVRLARADLLRDAQGRLDPTRPAWRTAEDNTFVSAFCLDVC